MSETPPMPKQARPKGAFGTLPERFVSALLAFSIVVWLFWIGWQPMVVFIGAASFLALREYRGMCFRRGIELTNRSIYIFAGLMMVASTPPLQYFDNIPWRELVLVACFMTTLISEVVRPSDKPLERIVYTIFGMVYIPYLLSFALLLRYVPNGFWYLVITLLSAYAADVGAYFAGGLFGKQKLAPEVSPAKTIEGSLGGIVLSFVIVFAMIELLRIFAKPGINLGDALMFSVLMASTGQLGDLAESIVKRSLAAKDSGTFLPGHGGILDRMDSVLFALPAAYFFLHLAVF